ncbi:MAG: class I SAM-dependent methyltransferase [Chloroflexi bacterium AL-W]|nr:class I SAM-dependent methyltransferase [Chloroflexi bacterium AL-N1]NOK69307.1 class I SAM-dependent methyltransferase [Chloroflexi bacterium AL-N10]NOK76368.1 class I SAM-dependent methyltransferase [Chloroflexi bacterium AL-N5]NOK83485.1 class I SAM-dependent methyltransferase [Chloroflexi bacterium AL-W]NOK91145.1 class I SAM-dependent methyltransferase [Chloroflexi bacterium AL-N15]
MMNDMLQKPLDELSRIPQTWNVLRYVVEAGFRGEKAVIEGELQPWQDVGQRLFLDFGCGTGAFAACFPSRQYVGVDIATHYVQYAHTARSGGYGVMDGSALALQGEQFDAALVLGVFHHLPDAIVRASVAELSRVLKPGATLLVMEDIAPPDVWNVAGHAMHWLDRGGFIRSDESYRMLLHPYFMLQKTYTMRSGICDYAVYVLERITE